MCTNVDVHREPGLLDSYRLFVSVGHDEYYSKEQFDELERFVNAGGNLAFFSANTLWWQVRFEDHEHTMVCYKDKTLDPYTGVDNSRVTVNWHADPVRRPPARLMGTYYNGSSGIPPGAQQVANPRSWAFHGVAVDSGQAFGYPMVGMEVDARTPDSPPVDLIARTLLPDSNDGGVLRPSEMVYYERTPAYGFAQGRGGKVFSGGTINWAGALEYGYNAWMRVEGQPDPIARTIAINVLDKLGCSLQPPRLAAPEDGSVCTGPQVLVEWYPAQAQRLGAPTRYTAFWRSSTGQTDSVETLFLSARAPVQPNLSYTWWVRAKGECGAEAQSAPRGFTTRTPTESSAAVRGPVLTVSRRGDRVVILVWPAVASEGKVEIFDVAGRRVRSFGVRHFPALATRLDWDLTDQQGLDVPAGIYFITAQVGSENARLKVPVVR